MSALTCFTTPSPLARPLHLCNSAHYPAWRETQPQRIRDWLDTQGFQATSGTLVLLPDDHGLGGAVLGLGEDGHDPFAYAHAPFGLPEGDWMPVMIPPTTAIGTALPLGWGLGAYRFDRYRQSSARRTAKLALAAPDAETLDILAAIIRVRDLVNTPTEDLGPEQLEVLVCQIADHHGAQCDNVIGESLLEQNFPAIHAVGRASHRPPRLIRLRWKPEGADDSCPHVILVGKGVCFDTGGLDLKAAAGMRLMKKDMGGAAHVIALAELIMARQLAVHLTVLIPAVENAIGPESFRPGDIIRTRNGVYVEIDNTDAEGRLILGDALAHAGELAPDLILDFATLTGAARIALGPDLPALFSNNEPLAEAWLEAGGRVYDPLWRMPLWRPYRRYLHSDIADLANAGSRMAGAVTAALYLQSFIPDTIPWAHLDTYAWNDHSRPGRPQGGEAFGLRAAWTLLQSIVHDAMIFKG